jgi:transcriptional regulator with XRE-family HTH domain
LIEAALIVSDRLPNAIDRHIASRMRLRRRAMGLTQKTIADALGVTFQQFQKYERSINRISAGALYPLALTLEVPVGYFFEGLPKRLAAYPARRRRTGARRRPFNQGTASV